MYLTSFATLISWSGDYFLEKEHAFVIYTLNNLFSPVIIIDKSLFRRTGLKTLDISSANLCPSGTE